MNIANMKFHIVQRYDMDRIEIWCFEYYGDKGYSITIDAPTGLLRKEEIPECVGLDDGKYRPLMSFPRYFCETLFREITAYQSEKGIKTKDENLIEGKLQATEVHLSDMRDIVTKLMAAFIKP